jgi:hypothetical protein
MRSLIALLLSSLLPLALAANLEIDHLTPDITCDRKTKNGDTIQMRMSISLSPSSHHPVPSPNH